MVGNDAGATDGVDVANASSSREYLGWKLDSLENLIDKTRDSVILGVTIYFESVET